MTTVVLEHLQHANSGSPDLTVGPTGNIGIGTANPSTTSSGYDGGSLHIHNDGTGSSIRLTNSTTGTGTSEGMLISKWNDSKTYFTNFDNGANTVFTQSNSSGTLITTLVMDGDGKVGIGTSTPSSKLEVDGGGIHVTSPTGIQGLIIDTDQSNATVSGRFVLKNNTSAASVYYSDSLGWTFHTGTILGTTSGTQRMYLTPEGYTRAPYQPSFMAHKTSHLAISGSGQVEAGDWSTSYVSGGHNTGGHFNTSNGRFTVPIAGRYKFDANIMHGLTSGDFQIWICVNGNTSNCIKSNSMQSTGGNWKQTTVTGLLNLQANDYISIFARSSATETYAMYGSSTSAFTTCNGYLLG